MTGEGPDKDRRVEYRGTGFYVGLVVSLFLALALLLLAVQNTQQVTIAFLAWDFDVPLFAVAVGGALLAVILDELIGLVWRRSKRARLEERAELDRLRIYRAKHGTSDEQGDDIEPGTTEAEPGMTEIKQPFSDDGAE